MKDIDEKDTPFLALALKLQCPVWSNDGDFEKQNLVEVYKTSYPSESHRGCSILESAIQITESLLSFAVVIDSERVLS